MCATFSNKWSWAHMKPALPYRLTCVEAKISAQAGAISAPCRRICPAATIGTLEHLLTCGGSECAGGKGDMWTGTGIPVR
jgi:hypothetical protein